MDIVAVARFVRGESDAETRPNKSLQVERLLCVLNGYPHLDLLISIVNYGVDPQWNNTHEKSITSPPKNHGSCIRNFRAVTKSIPERQDAGLYMGLKLIFYRNGLL